MTAPFSPTEISTARACWRRAAARFIFKIRGQRAKPYDGELGDAVHDLAERWNKLGHAPVPDRSFADNLFIAGLPYVPQPRMGASEDERTIEINGYRYKMRRDWDGTLGELPKAEELIKTYGPDCAAQLDHKTSSQPFKYGLWTREKWLDDAQAVLEMVELGVRTNSEVVASRWLYYQKPKKQADGTIKITAKCEAFPSDIVVGRDQLGRAHLRIVEPYARGLTELREAHAAGALTDFRSLPYNKDACGDYGGCDYLAHCGNYFPPQQAVAQGYGVEPVLSASIGVPVPPAPHERLDQALASAPPPLAPSAPTFPGAVPGLTGEREMSLFPQMANGQAPAPVLGQPPQFAPQGQPAQAPMGPPPGFPAQPPAFAPAAQPAPAPSPYAPLAPQGQPMPPFAPATTQYVQQPSGMYATAPAALAGQGPGQLTPAAQPFQGFQGVNAPEVRNPAPQQQAAPALPAFVPVAQASTPNGRPGLTEALAAAEVLLRFLQS